MKHFIVRYALPAVIALAAVLTAYGDESRKIDARHYLGEPFRVDNLTVWPVRTDAPVETGEILSLHEAQEKGLAKVREKGAGRGSRRDAATVNELVVENLSDRPILVTAGTIVKGGKQDRQIGQDFVIEAKATTPVDAFCVERGRWSHRREGRATGGVFEVTKMNAAKRLRASAQYDSDQGKVWRQVDHVNRKAANDSPTSSFLATVEDDEKAMALRQRLETTVERHFAGLDDKVVGFAYSVNGEPLAMRTFANRHLLDSHFESFVRTMSLEAQVTQHRDRRAGKETYDETASSEALLKMMRGIDEAEPEVRETAGLNKNRYRTNEWGGHSSCLIESGGRWVALTEDWTAPAELSKAVMDEMILLRAVGYTE